MSAHVQQGTASSSSSSTTIPSTSHKSACSQGLFTCRIFCSLRPSSLYRCRAHTSLFGAWPSITIRPDLGMTVNLRASCSPVLWVEIVFSSSCCFIPAAAASWKFNECTLEIIFRQKVVLSLCLDFVFLMVCDEWRLERGGARSHNVLIHTRNQFCVTPPSKRCFLKTKGLWSKQDLRLQ